MPFTSHNKEQISYQWDNKVAVSLLGKNEEVLVLGWADWKFCIGNRLQKPMYESDGGSYNIVN